MSEHNHQDLSGDAGRVPCHRPGEFDFEGWSQLAQRDAAGYFKARRQAIDAFIAAAPEHAADGLRQLQNNIDNLRACAGSPFKAAWQITCLMQEHVDLLGHQLELLQHETERLRGRIDAAPPRR